MAQQIKPKRHGNLWRIRPVDEYGIRRYHSYETREQAMQALREFQYNLEIKKTSGVKTSSVLAPQTFSELCDYQLQYKTPLKKDAKDDTSIINCHLRPAFGNLKLNEVNVVAVDKYRLERKDRSLKTISNHLTLLISMLRLAKEMNWIRELPNIKKPKIPKHGADYQFLRSDDEVKRFLRSAQQESKLIYVMYLMAVITGMRAGELAGLRREDIDLKNRIITVQRMYKKLRTKNDEIRRIPILDSLLGPLQEWLMENPLPVVFPNKYGNVQTRSARVFQEIFHRVLDNAGFQRGISKSKHYIRFHDLRHTFASSWMMKGGDIFKLQRVLGHKSQDMTQRYSHLSPSAFHSDYSRLQFDIQNQAGEILQFKK